jgi:hypothetical protein
MARFYAAHHRPTSKLRESMSEADTHTHSNNQHIGDQQQTTADRRLYRVSIYSIAAVLATYVGSIILCELKQWRLLEDHCIHVIQPIVRERLLWIETRLTVVGQV